MQICPQCGTESWDESYGCAKCRSELRPMRQENPIRYNFRKSEGKLTWAEIPMLSIKVAALLLPSIVLFYIVGFLIGLLITMLGFGLMKSVGEEIKNNPPHFNSQQQFPTIKPRF